MPRDGREFSVQDRLASREETLMGFLKRFFRNVFRDGTIPVGTSSFERLDEEDSRPTWESRGTATSR